MVLILMQYYLYFINGNHTCTLEFELVSWYLSWWHGIHVCWCFICYICSHCIYIGVIVLMLCHCIFLSWCIHLCPGIYIGVFVFMLVPSYLYQWRCVYIATIIFILISWYPYWCHGINIGFMVIMQVSWYLCWCHDIHIGVMEFKFMPLILF